MATDVGALTGMLGQSRLALLETLAHVSDAAWTASEWGVRGVVAHIAAWDEAAVATLHALAEGQTPPPPVVDEDAFNQRAVAAMADLSPVQVVIGLHAARARLVAAVSRAGDLGEFQFSWDARGTLAELVRGLVNHEQAHRAEIEQML